ncbi:DAK2 domain-containing protein [Parasporobacterium paucivorans]
MFRKMFLAGAANLESSKEWINELNVFPVPDGDTGTNMTLTIKSAVKEMVQLSNPNLGELAKAISSGSLRGARGNSGVILSQLFRGFSKEIEDLETIDAYSMANASHRAVETAYKAVMKPKEGTILTVARCMAEKVGEMVNETQDLEVILKEMVRHGEYILSQTPEMLPVLKQAGVVDSGGQGLIQIAKGALDAFLGIEVDYSLQEEPMTERPVPASAAMEDIQFGYCTEFIVNSEKKFEEKDEMEFKVFLESIGDSIVVVSDDEIIKVHVHTNDPGLVIQKGLSFGSLSHMKIDNMREEHRETLLRKADAVVAEPAETEKVPRKEHGFIAVSAGGGLDDIFTSFGVDYLIKGGQTMNPSTQDILEAIEKVNADNIFILPNNGNIILAAQQAKDMTEDKNVIVIPTKTIPQGISAMISYSPGKNADEVIAKIMEDLKHIKSAEITYAVRDTVIDGIEIKENDIMGIGEEGILAVGQNIQGTAIKTLQALVDENSEIISIYYGEDVTEKEAGELAARLEDLFPDAEVEVNKGGQPIYYYIISVE